MEDDGRQAARERLEEAMANLAAAEATVRGAFRALTTAMVEATDALQALPLPEDA